MMEDSPNSSAPSSPDDMNGPDGAWRKPASKDRSQRLSQLGLTYERRAAIYFGKFITLT